MKIIATTPAGYLVEATGNELANAAGFRQDCEAPGWVRDSGSYSRGSFIIGTVFKPSAAFDYLNKLREAERKVKDASAVLRGLADMMSMALPETIVPAAESEVQS